MCVLSFHGYTPLVYSFREGARPLRSPGSAPVMSHIWAWETLNLLSAHLT